RRAPSGTPPHPARGFASATARRRPADHQGEDRPRGPSSSVHWREPRGYPLTRQWPCPAARVDRPLRPSCGRPAGPGHGRGEPASPIRMLGGVEIVHGAAELLLVLLPQWSRGCGSNARTPPPVEHDSDPDQAQRQGGGRHQPGPPPPPFPPRHGSPLLTMLRDDPRDDRIRADSASGEIVDGIPEDL